VSDGVRERFLLRTLSRTHVCQLLREAGGAPTPRARLHGLEDTPGQCVPECEPAKRPGGARGE
jgi:hypothetical protein